MKIVLLEADLLGDDIDISVFEQFGEFTVYANTKQSEVAERVQDSDIIVVNKLLMNQESLCKASHLQMIAVTATGTNNIDLGYAKEHKVAVANVAGYSTNSVAQHTFAMLFYLLEKLPYYDNYVKDGSYSECGAFTHLGERFFELTGKTWGVLGLGAIGRATADIAHAFGCRVVTYSASGSVYDSPYEQLDWDSFLKESDIISMHAPLTAHTEKIMNRQAFEKMKNSAILLNVARGPMIDEQDLYDALTSGQIAAAGLDVLSVEPMEKTNPLAKLKDSKKLLITPHIAWATREARQRLIEEVGKNVEAFLKGEKRNRAD